VIKRPPMDEIDVDITRLHAAYAAELDPVRVIEEVFRRIEAANDPGIFITLVKRSAAKRAARELPPFDPLAKPLWGVPFAVKDNIDVKGLPTTAGCPDFAYRAKSSAHAVQKLIDAGAILIGKTNLDQFATGLVGVRTPYPVPRNPFDPTLVPGGSSSGSAVAVAGGMVTFALGTDTAGSGRVPAALNNIVGLKPSLGSISTRGVVPACRSLDCVSVFALTVEDAWRVFAVMAGHDNADPFSRPIVLGPPAVPPALRIGVPSAKTRAFFGDRRAAKAFDAAVADLEGLGAQVSDIDLAPFLEVAQLLYAGPWVAERYQAIRAFFERNPGALHPVTRKIIGSAGAHTAADAFAGLYRLAELKRRLEPVWNAIDVLAVPSVPTVYTAEQVAGDPIRLNARLGTYTNFVNLLDLAALAVPGRFRSDGLPAGVTLIAPRGQDALLAGVGSRLHRRSGVGLGAMARELPPASAAAAAAPPGWVELVVVGAHMSGLPLNRELTDLGAVFLRAAATRSVYRLYALPGGPPRRPGLLRVEKARGAPIRCEVWALAPEAFGRLVALIPPPLSIGTLELADDTRPKGFLVEAAGVRGAADVSRFGSWRAYLAARPSKAISAHA